MERSHPTTSSKPHIVHAARQVAEAGAPGDDAHASSFDFEERPEAGSPLTPPRTPHSGHLRLRLGQLQSQRRASTPSLEQLRRLNRVGGTWHGAAQRVIDI